MPTVNPVSISVAIATSWSIVVRCAISIDDYQSARGARLAQRIRVMKLSISDWVRSHCLSDRHHQNRLVAPDRLRPSVEPGDAAVKTKNGQDFASNCWPRWPVTIHVDQMVVQLTLLSFLYWRPLELIQGKWPRTVASKTGKNSNITRFEYRTSERKLDGHYPEFQPILQFTTGVLRVLRTNISISDGLGLLFSLESILYWV